MLLDGFKCVLQHLFLSIPIHSYVVQVDNYGQGKVAQCTAKDTLNNKLKIGGRLNKAHWHPEPLELAPVGNEG